MHRLMKKIAVPALVVVTAFTANLSAQDLVTSIVKAGITADGDVAGISATMADDVVWHAQTGHLSGDYEGKEAVLGYLGQIMAETGGTFSNEIHDMLANDEHVRQHQADMEQHWQDKLKRLRFDVDLARRRYEHVDPANRLVAFTLESEWNQALEELATTQQAYADQQSTPYELQSSLAAMRDVLANLRHYWFATEMPIPEQKRCGEMSSADFAE